MNNIFIRCHVPSLLKFTKYIYILDHLNVAMRISNERLSPSSKVDRFGFEQVVFEKRISSPFSCIIWTCKESEAMMWVILSLTILTGQNWPPFWDEVVPSYLNLNSPDLYVTMTVQASQLAKQMSLLLFSSMNFLEIPECRDSFSDDHTE